MNKLYLFPLSLLFLNFASTDAQQTDFDSDLALFRPKTQEAIALEIDPELIEEIKEEISAVLKNPDLEEQEQELSQSMTAALEKPSKTRQQQRKQEWVDEEEWQEEEMAIPSYPPRSQSTNQVQRSQAQGEQDSNREVSKPHVRRYPAPNAQPPRTQKDPNKQEQRTRPSKPLNAQPNTVEAKKRTQQQSQGSQRSLARTEQDNTETEFEQPSRNQNPYSNREQKQVPLKRKPAGVAKQQARPQVQYEEETNIACS